MWSGPRNISTALMRSFGNRRDAVVCDEPLYAHYLDVTGLDHPGRAEILAHHERDILANDADAGTTVITLWLRAPTHHQDYHPRQHHQTHHQRHHRY